MKRQAAEAEGEAAEIGLLASRRNGPSQQVNAPTVTTTTADVCGSTSDPVKGGEKELGDDNYITKGDELKEVDHLETENKWVPSSSDLERGKEKELGIQDEENRKSKGRLPVINWSAGSKDSIQDETKNDTYISNYDETTGQERDELMKEADLETGNKRVPATFGKQTRKQLRSSHKRRRSLESKELGDDNYITKGDELKEVDHLETENKWVPSSSDLERGKVQFGAKNSSAWGEAFDDIGESFYSAIPLDAYFRQKSRLPSREPNPGIKRPTVTVLQTPPPPP